MIGYQYAQLCRAVRGMGILGDQGSGLRDSGGRCEREGKEGEIGEGEGRGGGKGEGREVVEGKDEKWMKGMGERTHNILRVFFLLTRDE